MSRLHICNTFFEQELEGEVSRGLKNWLDRPVVRKLQYLPLLYAEEGDRVLVTKVNEDRRCCSIDAPLDLPIVSWGPSEAIGEYARKWGLVYECPEMEVVRRIQSKAFAWEECGLKGAELLYSEGEVRRWLEVTKGPKVLKRMFGYAGQGHFLVGEGGDLEGFLEREFARGRPVLAEPWLDRTMDFSSQWEIGDGIELCGVTRFETTSGGVYSGTLAGPDLFEGYEWAVERHLEMAWPLVEKMKGMGFWGSLGIDAFVYGDEKLHGVVEINARRTMSRVALDVHKKKGGVIRLRFERGELFLEEMVSKYLFL